MKKYAWLWLLSIMALGAVAQELHGITSFTPTSTTQCYALTDKKNYLLQANLSAQDYTSAQYLYSSTNVFISRASTVTVEGAQPAQDGGWLIIDGGLLQSDGGWAYDGGATYWQLKTPVVLKDTDTYSFQAILPGESLCYRAGTTADAGVSSMTLNLHEVIH